MFSPMSVHLVLDIGNSFIKGGLFKDKTLLESFSMPHSLVQEKLMSHIQGKKVSHSLISSVNSQAEKAVTDCLQKQKISYIFLDYKQLKLVLEVDEPDQLGHDRIANAYGALTLFPLNDCIVMDIGTAITADYIAKEGKYLGGMIYPGAELCAKALAEYTDRLPLVQVQKPESALAKTTQSHLQSGIYYGQLGALERMIDALKLTAFSPSSIKVIATGGGTRNADLIDDLKELVDHIDSHLTLVGLHEILIELVKKKE